MEQAQGFELKAPVPLLRIFDESAAKQFYLEFLEFHLDWEHRFEDNMPLYMQISSGSCILHLTEHHGDCCPGAAVRIEAANVRDLQQRLLAKRYKHARPGLEQTPWDTLECTVLDPSGNRIVFYEPLPRT